MRAKRRMITWHGSGSEHRFKCCGANSRRDFCVCVKETKRETGREGGRRADVILMARHASLLCPE